MHNDFGICRHHFIGPMVRTLPQSVMNEEGHSIGRGALTAMYPAAAESLGLTEDVPGFAPGPDYWANSICRLTGGPRAVSALPPDALAVGRITRDQGG
jgi:hypothetical protein